MSKPETSKKREPVDPNGRGIADVRHCPICWAGRGGYGVAYSTQGSTRYYKCSKTVDPLNAPCGHTWTATVQLEVIKVEHRITRLDGQR